MPRIIHPLSGLIAMLTIAAFWLSTTFSELFGSEAMVIAVKTSVPWGFLLLVPALVAAGSTGWFMSKGERGGLVGTKLKRMPFIAATGMLVLLPAALFLAVKAKAGQLDASFYTVQALELIAGAVNLTFLALSMRDGLALTKWRREAFALVGIPMKAKSPREDRRMRAQVPNGPLSEPVDSRGVPDAHPDDAVVLTAEIAALLLQLGWDADALARAAREGARYSLSRRRLVFPRFDD